MASSLACLVIFCFCLLVVRAAWQFSSVNINVSDSCKAAIHKLSQLEVSDPQLMAYYWDSWGKPSDGILTGHTTFLGYYDECIDLKNTAVGETKYCIYSMSMDTFLTDKSDRSKDFCSSSECPTPLNMSSAVDIKVGICYPSHCSPTEFATVLSSMTINNVVTMNSPFSNKIIYFTMKLKGNSNSLAFCSDVNVELDRGAKAVIIICAILIGLVAVGTTIDLLLLLFASNTSLSSELTSGIDSVKTVTNKKDRKVNSGSALQNQPAVKYFILAFSLYNTVPKLVSTKQSNSTIKGLNFMKILFNFLIVIHHSHVFAITMFSSASQNTPLYLYSAFSRLIFQPPLNFTFSVDAFFLASATVSAYQTFKDVEKYKKFRTGYFYLNRLFRLSPMYYLFTFIAYKLSVHFGQGPVWFSQDYHAYPNSWWYNILYISNTLPPLKSCMLATWHICADMQLFIISPIFIVLLYHSLRYGLIAIILAMIAATLTVGYLAAKNGYWAALLFNPQATEQVIGLYFQPFYRINTYLTGIILGYILYKKYNINTLSIRNWLKQLIFMVLLSTAIYLCTIPTLFGTYGEYSRTHHFSDFENVTFLMFTGLAFSIGLSIIIYICNTGYGGMFSSFLSWPGWDPLARLTFGVFLIHQMVIFYILGSLQSSLKYTDTVFVMISVFTLVMSYILSAVTAVCVELPIAKVVSLCFKLAGMEPRSHP